MIVSITYIRLKSYGKLPTFFLNAVSTMIQAQKAPGGIKQKSSSKGLHHYTISSWENKEAMMDFVANNPQHIKAMKVSAKISALTQLHTYETEKLPTWKEAKTLVKAEGRVVEFVAE